MRPLGLLKEVTNSYIWITLADNLCNLGKLSNFLSLSSYKKKPKKGDLSEADRDFNRTLSRERICIEHVNRRLKIFKLLAQRYRNRRRRYGLRFNLIAALYNYELNLAEDWQQNTAI